MPPKTVIAIATLLCAAPLSADAAPAAAPVAGAGAARTPAERTAADTLRALCAAGAQETDAALPILSADVRIQPLRYGKGLLRLDLSSPTLIEEGPRGVVEVFAGEPVEATLAMATEEGAKTIRAQAQGKVQARLSFLPEQNALTGSPCLRLGGGRVTRVRISPLWVTLVQQGQGEPLRLYTPRGEPLAVDGRPDVQIDTWGMVFDGDRADLDALGQAAQGVRGKALLCYQKALTARPNVSGKVILGLDLDREGRAAEIRVEVDATGEAALVRCLREATQSATFPRLRRGGHLSLPFNLRRDVRAQAPQAQP